MDERAAARRRRNRASAERSRARVREHIRRLEAENAELRAAVSALGGAPPRTLPRPGWGNEVPNGHK